MTPFLPDDEKLAAVRAALPATSAGIYLDTPSHGPLPAEVHRAMNELAEWELAFGRGSPEYHLETLQRMDEARAAVAAVGVADPAAIVLAHSTTDALDLAVRLIDWRPGDRVVTVGPDRAGAPAALDGLRERSGVDLVTVDIDGDGDDDRTSIALEATLAPGTRLVWIEHVAPTTGTVRPIARIAELVHARGALVAVDGGQAFGAIPVDLTSLGADVYAIPAERWLLGPDGIAALHLGPAIVERARGIFDAPSHHRPSIVGLARSVAWLSMYVGWEWIHHRAGRLARSAAARLSAIDGVEVLTPPDRMATLLAFRLRGWPADVAGEELAKRTFAILGTVPELDALRIGIGFFNSESELERFAAGVELLAGHSPETLPPRQLLAILGQD